MKSALIAVGISMAACVTLSACQMGADIGQTPRQELVPATGATTPSQSRAFTQTTMMAFAVSTPPQAQTSTRQGLTSPPQGLTSPPQGLTSPPQSLTSPPQGLTSPPLGVNTALERSQFSSFDADADGYWNSIELGAYVQAWRALSDSGFATRDLGLELNIEALMDTYDRSHDRLLDYLEARNLHDGLRQALTSQR